MSADFPARSLRTWIVLLASAAEACADPTATSGRAPGVHKLDDVVIYKDDRFYSAFPSIVRRPNGELLVAFRRAPERRMFGVRTYAHTDSNGYLVLVRSGDDGKTWSQTPELIYADPFGGSQDPCMVQLRDHSILCTTYRWAMMYTSSPRAPAPRSRER